MVGGLVLLIIFTRGSSVLVVVVVPSQLQHLAIVGYLPPRWSHKRWSQGLVGHHDHRRGLAELLVSYFLPLAVAVVTFSG